MYRKQLEHLEEQQSECPNGHGTLERKRSECPNRLGTLERKRSECPNRLGALERKRSECPNRLGTFRKEAVRYLWVNSAFIKYKSKSLAMHFCLYDLCMQPAYSAFK
jgi:chromosome segregation ATPase